VHGRLIGDQLGRELVQLFDCVRFVEAERGARAFGSMAETIPDFAFLVFFTAEEDALRCVPRDQNENSLGFAETGEIVEVAVVPVRVVRIAVAHALRRRGNEGDPSLHLSSETRAPAGVHGRIHRVGSHGHERNT
jgi:hypothetical protein